MPRLSNTDVTPAGVGNGRKPERTDTLAGASLALCTAGELFGGVERHVLDLCTFVQQRTGAHPHLAVFHDGELAARARAAGVPTEVLRGRHRYDLRLSDELTRLVLSTGIRVLHAHGYKATIVCALAKRRMNRGVVGDAEHNVRLIRTEHGLIEPVGSAIGWAKMHVNWALDLLATRRSVDAVCYVTADLEHHYRNLHEGLLRRVIHNGIQPLDRDSFVRPRDLEPGFFHLGIVGRVTGVKGIASAIRAIETSRIPAIVRLNVIGTGPSEESLGSLSATLGLQGRVRFLGFKPNVHEYMAHLDALLMPSLHEGLPYTLLEAMSLGLPIIASRVGGLAEVLRDGQTGILVPAGDVSRLALAIEQVVARGEAARALGLEAAAEQRRGYTLETMGQAYWQVYEAALRARELTHGKQ
jgi:glycosyltransferase involved in cell wall biosynthesis